LEACQMNSLKVLTALAAVALVTAPAFAQTTASPGQDLFTQRCSACHSAKPIRKPGPLLSGIVGRQAGTVPGYSYSPALAASHVIWTDETLDKWLSGPPKFIPGVRMMAVVNDPQQRKEIIAYLHTLGAQAAK
jgi:cytochrome c